MEYVLHVNLVHVDTQVLRRQFGTRVRSTSFAIGIVDVLVEPRKSSLLEIGDANSALPRDYCLFGYAFI